MPQPSDARTGARTACLVLAAEGTNGRSADTLARELRADPFLGRLPLIILVRDIRVNDLDWATLGVDDYIAVPYRPDEIPQRVRLCLSRLERSLDANPLTRLPGNSTILHETHPNSVNSSRMRKIQAAAFSRRLPIREAQIVKCISLGIRAYGL